MKPRVGFIGAGLMGHGVAKNFLEEGYALSLLGHRNRAPIDDLVQRGARELKSPAELAAKSDVLFTCLPNSDVVEKVVCGRRGCSKERAKAWFWSTLRPERPRPREASPVGPQKEAFAC
jgi:3-hydroxyisobutyrate dehydrogenase-like beta-hydroxyacid dehydrogenase